MDPASRAAFDPSLYPRTYRRSMGVRLIETAFGVFFLISGLLPAGYIGLLYVSLLPPDPHVRDPAIAALVSVAIALFGALIVVYNLTYRVVLFPDAIEAGSWWMKRLWRDEISGRRVVIFRGRYYSRDSIYLYRRGHRMHKLAVTRRIEADAAYHAWFNGIPDLDA
jgi:hypothetical protein